MKNLVLFFVATIIVAGIVTAGYLWTPVERKLDAKAAIMESADYSVRIIRDDYGVPHIYGPRNADVAFGLAVAHAQDDWTTIEDVIRFSRGELARKTGREGAITDYLVAAMDVKKAIDDKYETDISTATQEILSAYAAGVNYHCATTPGECSKNIAPVTAKDIVAGFVSRTPFFYGLEETLTSLFEPEDDQTATLHGGERRGLAYFHLTPGAEFGSNAMAVSPSRSADGHTRLMVNSHQPFTGPVAWYEARLKSEEGWDIIGGLFPGSPLVLHGATPNLGWAFTVNKPDLVDVYALDVDDEKDPQKYRFDGEWRRFKFSEATFRVRLWGPFSLPVTRPVRRTVHGPVFETPGGWVAVAYAGDRDIRAVEQWRRMNFASDATAWRDAFSLQGIPSFNVVYADKEGNIGYYYNAAIPIRDEKIDWSQPVPGDDGDAVWSGVRPFSIVPMVENPTTGYVGNANNSPFEAAAQRDAPKTEDYPDHFGVDRRSTNRGNRLNALFLPDSSITADEFELYKMDASYAEDSRLVQFVEGLTGHPDVKDSEEFAEAIAILQQWDRTAEVESRGAALAILTGQKALGYTLGAAAPKNEIEALRETMQSLRQGFGRLDPRWGDVNQLVRGNVSIPVDGGPDTLRAIYGIGDPAKGPITASFGDTYIMLVDWAPNGDQIIKTIHQFGAATSSPASPHYADQTGLFAAKEWKIPSMTLEEVLDTATSDVVIGAAKDK